MLENLSLSVTARADKNITRHNIIIDGDDGRSFIGASGSELGPSGQGRSRSGEDLEKVTTWNGGMQLRIEDVFGTEGSSVMNKSGEGSGMDFESCGALGNLNTCHHPDADQILTTTPHKTTSNFNFLLNTQ